MTETETAGGVPRQPERRMSTPLTPAQAALREECIARASAILSRAWAEMAQLYAEGGAEAVAAAAWEPGGPSREEIAALYEGWVAEERAKRAAQASSDGKAGAARDLPRRRTPG